MATPTGQRSIGTDDEKRRRTSKTASINRPFAKIPPCTMSQETDFPNALAFDGQTVPSKDRRLRVQGQLGNVFGSGAR